MISKSTSNQNVPLVASISTPTLTGNQLHIHEPPFQEEKTLIQKSEVLIPFTSSDITHAFFGPFPDLNTNVARISEFFPCYHGTKTLAAIDQPLDLTYMSTRVFYSSPYTNQSNYLSWLNKVESKIGQAWKDQGLFDLIQLSRVVMAKSTEKLPNNLRVWMKEKSNDIFKVISCSKDSQLLSPCYRGNICSKMKSDYG